MEQALVVPSLYREFSALHDTLRHLFMLSERIGSSSPIGLMTWSELIFSMSAGVSWTAFSVRL